MKKFNDSENKQRVNQITRLLEKEFPKAEIALHYTDPLQLLVATILSAQTTDETVNRVTRTLFKKYKSAEDLPMQICLSLNRT